MLLGPQVLRVTREIPAPPAQQEPPALPALLVKPAAPDLLEALARQDPQARQVLRAILETLGEPEEPGLPD